MTKPTKLTTLLRIAVVPVALTTATLAVQAQPQATAGSRAASAPQGGQEARTAGSEQSGYRALRASQLIGKEVRNPEGKNIGQIRDLVVNMKTGDVRYAILEFDPGIFQAERLFAVPTKELRLGSEDRLVYNMTRQKLEQVGVPRADWNTAWRDPNYLPRLDKTWGVAQPSRDARAFRISDLLGKDVKSRAGNDIGDVKDLVINMAAQKVHYAVLAFDPSWTTPEQNYAFPLHAFQLSADKDELVLDVDRTTVQAMKSFGDSRYSNLNDRTWVVDVDRYLVTVVPTSARSTGSAASAPARAASGANRSAGPASASSATGAASAASR